MKKPKKWQKDQGLADDDTLLMPEIYFTLCFLCDKDPETVLQRVAGEWGKAGGKKLYLKDILSFDTKTAVTIFHLRHDNTDKAILSEFQLALNKAKDIAENEDEEGAMTYMLDYLPLLNVHKFIPKITGQDTAPFRDGPGSSTIIGNVFPSYVMGQTWQWCIIWRTRQRIERSFRSIGGTKCAWQRLLTTRVGRRRGLHHRASWICQPWLRAAGCISTIKATPGWMVLGAS
jgi:hypothetical protein